MSCSKILSTTLAAALLMGSFSASRAETLLVFTKTASYRHASIEPGVAALRELGETHGFDVVHGEDAAIFNDADLERFAAIVFLSTTGDILEPAQQAAMERFVRRGRGFVGIHAAADTEYDWPWYGRLLGAYFDNHPEIQEALIEVVDDDHASTRMLPSPWRRTDEWYNYQSMSDAVHVVLELDEDSYEGGEMGDKHPIAWYHEYDGGRAWYTGLGHTAESYGEPRYLEHLAGGIAWVLGRHPEP